MKLVLLRIVILIAAAAAIAGLDGARRGMTMPPKVDTAKIPTINIPKPQTTPAAEETPAPVQEEVTQAAPTQEIEQTGGFSAALLKELLDTRSAMAIDARMMDEYIAGHIPGAYQLAVEDFGGGQIPELVFSLIEIQTAAPEIQFVVYCGGGECHASNIVGSKLQEFGIQNVFIFEGGFPAWQQAGFEVQQGEPVTQ